MTWEEITLKSSKREKLDFCSIMIMGIPPNICELKDGQERWNSYIKDLNHFLTVEKDPHLFVYYGEDIRVALGFKWSDWQNCLKLSHLMSDTLQPIEKFKKVIDVTVPKIMEYMEEKKCYKFWGKPFITEPKKQRLRSRPYVAKGMRYFWNLIEEGLNKHGFTLVDDKEKGILFVCERG